MAERIVHQRSRRSRPSSLPPVQSTALRAGRFPLPDGNLRGAGRHPGRARDRARAMMVQPGEDWFKRVGFLGLLGFVAALQFSIAAANIFFGLALLMWLLRLATRRTTFDAPAFFIPLAAYGAATLISAACSSDPAAGFVDSKQLVLFLLVPLAYDLARGASAALVLQVIISVGAISAAVGVVQYGLLQYDNLGRRAQGSLGHYMTYSGLLMLVTCAACARVLFSRERAWPLLMLPALIAALAASFSRSAWVGTCAGVAVLALM